jgi:hypothetical protein
MFSVLIAIQDWRGKPVIIAGPRAIQFHRTGSSCEPRSEEWRPFRLGKLKSDRRFSAADQKKISFRFDRAEIMSTPHL